VQREGRRRSRCEDTEQPEPPRRLDVKEEEVEIAGLRVLKNEQQSDNHDYRADDVPRGRGRHIGTR